MALWHEDGPRSLLHQLLYGAAQILDSPSLGLMLFVADPWLRRSMEERAAEGEDRGTRGDVKQMLHTTFYLAGKVTLHGYRRDGLRAEPPRFPDLASLPIQGRGPVLALPLLAGPGRVPLAALQATAAGPEAAGPGGGPETAASCNALALSDSQVVGLQLLCTTAAGILDMHRQVESVKAVHTRSLGCLEVVAKVHSAVNIVEFEQRAKLQMTSFFNVVSARIAFYSPTTRELLLTATRAHRRTGAGLEAAEHAPALAIGRRNITRISVQDGIVGRCVRKRQVFHLDPIMQSPFVSEIADGVEMDGEKGQINMLAGPMVAELSDEGSRVVGVLQLIQKRQPSALEQPMAAGGSDAKDKPARRSCCDAFTQEDQSLFGELLRVLGMAAYRTMQVQSRCDMEEPSGRQEPSIDKLLGVS